MSGITAPVTRAGRGIPRELIEKELERRRRESRGPGTSRDELLEEARRRGLIPQLDTLSVRAIPEDADPVPR